MNYSRAKTEEFAEWKKKILQEVDNKIISLKHGIKFHKTNPVLKQDAVTEYLRELHNKYVLVPIDKAANNIAMICKKYSVTVIFKEIGILDAGNEMYEKIDKNQEEINIINRKKKAKSITTYDFSTLYTTLPHDKLIKMLCNVIDFVFEGENRTHICISKNNVKYL